MPEFKAFPKIARYSRPLIITEKLDGTNAQVTIEVLDDEESYESALCDPYCAVVPGLETGDSPLAVYAGSRKRWIAPEGAVIDVSGDPVKGTDNFGFAQFVWQNVNEIVKLGPGTHYGEWYGKGIQRGYGLDERRFALFNVSRWEGNPDTPDCVDVVPILFDDPDMAMYQLRTMGSAAVPTYMNPEGIIIYHSASKTYFKKTIKDDDMPKGGVQK